MDDQWLLPLWLVLLYLVESSFWSNADKNKSLNPVLLKYKIKFTITFKSSDMVSATLGGKRIRFFNCTRNIFLTFESSNGIWPHAIMYRITPMLHISCILGSYGWPDNVKHEVFPNWNTKLYNTTFNDLWSGVCSRAAKGSARHYRARIENHRFWKAEIG